MFVLIEQKGSVYDVIKFLERQASKDPYNNLAKEYIQKIRNYKG